MGLHSGGLISGRIIASEIWGAYFREGLFYFIFILFFFFLLEGGGGGGGLLLEFYGIFAKATVTKKKYRIL